MHSYPKRIGPYEVVGPLGKGAMGEVFKAVQPSLNRVVAIKVLPASFAKDPKQVERFHREAEAIAMLNHPNVVQIIDKDQDGELLYFVMEYVPGTSLDKVLGQRRLSLREALLVFREVASGLKAAHASSIVHRDLNPRNILVSEDLRSVKLVDFGISQIESISRERGTLSTSEISLGTLHYMAPEQGLDMKGTDHRADIYSAGVLLYEMLTGKVPVGRFSLPSQLNSEVPSDVDPIVLRCLSTEPEDRYLSVQEMLTALAQVEERLKLSLVDELHGIQQSTSRMFRRSGKTLARNKRKWASIAVGIVVLAGSVVALSALRSSDTQMVSAMSPESEVTAVRDGEGSTSSTLALEPLSPFDASSYVTGEGVYGAGVTPPQLVEQGPSADPNGALVPTETAEFGESAALDEEMDSGQSPSAAPSVLATELKVVRGKFEAQLYEAALSDLSALIASHGDEPDLAQVFLLKAEIEAARDRFESAVGTLVEVETRFAGSGAAITALYERAKLTLELKGRERDSEAIELFALLAERYPRSSLAPLALHSQAALEPVRRKTTIDTVLRINVPPALVTLRRLVERYPSHRVSEEAYWRLAEIYEDLKRFDLAVEACENLARRFPKTRYEAWWKAGQIYDKRLEKEAEALAAYRKVSEGSSHFQDAQKRIQKLVGS